MKPFSLDPQLFNSQLYRQIFDTWFSGLPLPASSPPFPLLQRWFGVKLSEEEKLAFDEKCGAIAKKALLSIGPDQVSLPEESADGAIDSIAAPFVDQCSLSEEMAPQQTALALILMLDQYSRNIFRTDAHHCYQHYDRMSLAILHKIVFPRGLDKHPDYLDSLPWRQWFYLPLMHSERIEDHELIRQNLEEHKKNMEAKGDQTAIDFTNYQLDYEKRHRVILDRFGRYPHRNKVMGRDMTKEEQEYLDDGGETFTN